MTITSSPPLRAPAIPLTFAALPGGRFPSVLTGGDSRVTAPAGGAPMLVVHRYEDLLSVKSSPAWRMANRLETPLTGAELVLVNGVTVWPPARAAAARYPGRLVS